MTAYTTFLNMAAILEGFVVMFAVWSDGTVRDVRGQLLEGFDPLETPVISRNSAQSAALRVPTWKRGFANGYPWEKIASIHAANGDHVHTLKEWMLGAEETNRKGETFLHFAGVIEGRDDGAAQAASLWGHVVEAFGLENEADVASAA